MCGILFTNKLIDNLTYIIEYLQKRGPDNTNHVIIKQEYHFIHTLLSMTGEITVQPFVYNKNNKHVVAMFNGEIYNYKNFDSNYMSDGECIIPLYLKYGEKFVDYLDGEFCVLVCDFTENKLLISTDIFSTKPLWLAIENKQIGVSSYKSCLTRLSFMNIVQIYANKTYIIDLVEFKIIKELTVHEFNLNQHKTTFDDFNKAFENSLIKRTKYAKHGIFIGLSSGYDSGAIACGLNKLNIPFTAYSIIGSENVDIIKARSKLLKDTKIIDLSHDKFLNARQYIKNNVEHYDLRIDNGVIESFEKAISPFIKSIDKPSAKSPIIDKHTVKSTVKPPVKPTKTKDLTKTTKPNILYDKNTKLILYDKDAKTISDTKTQYELNIKKLNEIDNKIEFFQSQIELTKKTLKTDNDADKRARLLGEYKIKLDKYEQSHNIYIERNKLLIKRINPLESNESNQIINDKKIISDKKIIDDIMIIDDKTIINQPKELKSLWQKIQQTPKSLTDDNGSVGLSYICSISRPQNTLIYLSGSGADEIFSDYGFNGVKYFNHSTIGGKFPDDLNTVYPWKNFFSNSQRAYLMKEEYVSGSYGVEGRYPFLDKQVVQEFLWLSAKLKNSEYKAPIFNYLSINKFPLEKNQKIGFNCGFNGVSTEYNKKLIDNKKNYVGDVANKLVDSSLIVDINNVYRRNNEYTEYFDPSKITYHSDNCYIYKCTSTIYVGDKYSNVKSPFILYENNVPMKYPRSDYDDIIKLGNGRYSHMFSYLLYFSSSDNSNPITNGKFYRLSVA